MSSLSFRFEVAQLVDVVRIQQIYAHHVLNGLGTFEENPPSLVEMHERYQKITAAGFPFIVVKLDNLVVGYAYAGHFRERSAYRHTVEDSIYVAPEFVGHGVGEMLLIELIRLCRARGYRELVALIGDSRNHASINLHHKLGFSQTGIMQKVGYKFEQFVDVVIMQLSL
ncbi:MAG: N-acetyltransferase [Burkholderiales bacterium]|nr:N-acetyltransferase [Burkholderiales bacterium]